MVAHSFLILSLLLMLVALTVFTVKMCGKNRFHLDGLAGLVMLLVFLSVISFWCAVSAASV